MTRNRREVTGGVDTHRDTHHAAVVDQTGRLLGDRQFDTTPTGNARLLAWLDEFGRVTRVGVEGTGSYGAGLTRHLTDHSVVVVEVDRPDRKARRAHGKSDPLDAIAAARAALAGTASGIPKARTGPVEAIRVLRVTRSSAVKSRTAAINQLKMLIVSAPDTLRDQLHGLSTTALIRRCGGFRIDTTTITTPLTATKLALRSLARRITNLTAEITRLDTELRPLITATAPRTTSINAVGAEVAGQLLTTAGDNPHRLHSEAAFTHLCGVAPIPASSGRTDRHRLNRGGDRAANNALRTVILNRLRWDPATRAYAERRTQQGLSKKDIIRCLKRYAARQIYHAIRYDLAHTTT